MWIAAILAVVPGVIPLVVANSTDAIPIGNGRLGGMVFGIPVQERIQLNEETVWSGSHRDRLNQDSSQTVSEVRDLLTRGQAGDAEKLANLGMMGK